VSSNVSARTACFSLLGLLLDSYFRTGALKLVPAPPPGTDCSSYYRNKGSLVVGKRFLEDLGAVADVVDDIDAEGQIELRVGQCGVFGPCAYPAKAARVASARLGQHRR
jgi:hypothetical protein